MESQATLPQFLNIRNYTGWLYQTTVVVGGVILVGLLAKISIPLPWTPVPITGQTFGVSVMALLYGRKLGALTIAAYLAGAALGLPILATAAFGPTAGYLGGMFLGSIVIGTLADRGWTRSFRLAFLACLIGSVFVFGAGLLVLAAFVPKDQLIQVGLLPFIPGDILKSLLAAAIATGSVRLVLGGGGSTETHGRR